MKRRNHQKHPGTAVVSLFLPGAGQLIKKHFLKGILMFLLYCPTRYALSRYGIHPDEVKWTGLNLQTALQVALKVGLYFFVLFIHIWSAYDAYHANSPRFVLSKEWKHKKHAIPAILCLFCPGAGQLIKQHFLKGTLLGLYWMLTWAIVWCETPPDFPEIDFKQLGYQWKLAITPFIISIYIWGIDDAYHSQSASLLSSKTWDKNKKHPIPGILSLFCPGAGQMVKGHFLKAVVGWLFWPTVLLFILLYGHPPDVSWANLPWYQIIFEATCGFFFTFIYIPSVVFDAYNSNDPSLF